MFRIDKTFEFCYGHRVHTQMLDGRYADDLKCACRHLHGHEGKVQIFMEASRLNDQGMVTDFRHLEWLKRWINAHVDHKFIIDRDDPLYNTLVPYVEGAPAAEPVTVGEDQTETLLCVGCHPGIHSSVTSELRELLEGILIVSFVPTSENLARWMHGLVQHCMKPLGIHVSQVDWWETPKSRSSYIAPHGA